VSAVTRLALLSALTVASGAQAVGLGPLAKQGVVAGDKKAFYLTVFNADRAADTYALNAIGFDDEFIAPRVAIYPSRVRLGAGQSRQVLVIAESLVAGETYRFRVCAERAQEPEGVSLHARVCSKLTALRLAATDRGGDAIIGGNERAVATPGTGGPGR
jgi:hypothetical protein